MTDDGRDAHREKGHDSAKARRSQEIDRLLKREQLDVLFSRTRVSVLGLLAAGAAFGVFQANAENLRAILAWYLALLACVGIRVWLARRYSHDADAYDRLDLWLFRYRAGVFLTCLVIAAVSFLPIEHTGPSQALLVIFLTGIAAGALAVIADAVSLAIYVLVLMGPSVVISALEGSRLGWGISLLTLILMVFYIKFSKSYNDTLRESSRLQYENDALLKDLLHEQTALNNRLGRILNASSNEIYVIDSESLLCLQVNAGAIENLGYTEEEIKGTPVYEFLDGLGEDDFKALIQRLREKSKDSHFFRGHHRRKDGSIYPVETHLQLSHTETPPIVVLTVVDITERDEYEKRLYEQANFDQLTGLPNRHSMLSLIEQAVGGTARKGTILALLYMDLDNFKHINDSMGHAAGDELLKEAAARIRSVLRETDTPARLGGDEFLLMLEGIHHQHEAEEVALRIIEAFKKPFLLQSRTVYSTSSVGISLFPRDGRSVESLIRSADMAMYEAKIAGKSQYRVFSQEMHQAAERQLLLATHLRRALEKGELYLEYQPIMDIEEGEIVGAEALLRWKNPELGQVPPDQFIQVAEHLGLIEDIGCFVLMTACEEAAKWPALPSRPRYVAVNVSPQQFRNHELLARVDEALAHTALPPAGLVLEITESLLVQDSDTPMIVLQGLRDRDIRLALDDFGTGYSSLSYLKKFPMQVLKIDRSFIANLGESDSDEALVKAIVAMAKSLNLDIVGEGIETEEQLAFMQQWGVRLIQGYYFGRPVVAEEFRQMIEFDSLTKTRAAGTAA